MSPHFEKLVVDSNWRRARDFREKLTQRSLNLTGRWRIGAIDRLEIRGGQGTLVEFAVCCQGQVIQLHECGWNHVLRQRAFQPGLECVCIRYQYAIFCHQIRNQTVSRCSIGHYGRTSDTVGKHIQYRHLDFTWLDSVSSNLDLLIGTTKIFKQTFGVAAYKVTRAVHPRSRWSVWIGNKFFSTLSRTIDIPPANALASNVQFSNHTIRHEVERLIQHKHLHVVDRVTNRNSSIVGSFGIDNVDATTHNGFSWSIFVDQAGGWRMGAPILNRCSR